VKQRERIAQVLSRLAEILESMERNLRKPLFQVLKRTGSNAYLVGTCPASLCVFANWKIKNDVTAYIASE
jgi:hypothetical protein